MDFELRILIRFGSGLVLNNTIRFSSQPNRTDRPIAIPTYHVTDLIYFYLFLLNVTDLI